MGDEYWLDSSKVDAFHLCPQKYAYRYEEHLVPVDRKRDSPILFGGAIHKALETLYRGTAFDKVKCPLGPCARCKGNEIPRFAAIFLANYLDDPDDPREIRTVDRGLELLGMYLAKWRREPFKVLAVEVPFELSYETHDRVDGDLTFKYIGRIDLIIDYDGTPMTVDHKSTTRFGMVFDSSFKLSGQFTGYMKGGSKIINQEITSALANALRVTTKIDDASFARIFTHRTPEEFDTWENELRHVASEIVRMRETGFWPKSAPFACGAYNRICEYYPLCISAKQTRETLKQAAYEYLPWEPRKVDDE
jgi:PD-(D/E)XK nuclease superfamily